MSAKWKLLTAVIVLIVGGGGVAAHKALNLGVPFWRGALVNEWEIEAKVTFLANGKKVKVKLALPELAGSEAARHDSGSLDYNFNVERTTATAIWSADSVDDRQALYYRLRIDDRAGNGAEPVPVEDVVNEDPGLSGSVGEAAKIIAGRARQLSSDPDAVFTSVFRSIRDERESQEFVLLRRHYETESKTTAEIRMGLDLLALAGVPARIAWGVAFNEDRGTQVPMPLVEYSDGVYWKVRDPEDAGEPLADGIFVWHRGDRPLLDVSGGESSKVTFTVARERIPMSRLEDLSGSPLFVSTVLGLPLSERAIFRYIVLIPLGAFVVVVMRNMIGVPTLGTFMPVLIALALLEMPLLRGLSMISILLAAGLSCRFLLSRLNLLVVPRVAACVVIVTLLMMLMSVLGHRIGMGGGVQITLFPMIIIAWTIERMSLIWEEEGKRSALVQIGGSLLVAVFAYLFMRIGQVRYWAFYFPELLLVLLAGILLIGRFTGYRLSELVRFRNFQQ
ncbi:MAG: UUP1 family membrane protein [Verrucomicrobiota bacterium]